MDGFTPHPDLPTSKGGRGKKRVCPVSLCSAPIIMGKDEFGKEVCFNTKNPFYSTVSILSPRIQVDIIFTRPWVNSNRTRSA